MQHAFEFQGVEDCGDMTYTPCSLAGSTVNYTQLSESERRIVEQAEAILYRLATRPGQSITSPEDISHFLQLRLATLMHEEFHIVHLDNRHRVLAVERLARGTVDGASIYPREVVRSCLLHNTAAAVFAHGHPSGLADPSKADCAITRQLTEALQYIGVRVLDHIVVASGECVSMAARGLI